jgi:tetratricopeptide (TPR) repeat protein
VRKSSIITICIAICAVSAFVFLAPGVAFPAVGSEALTRFAMGYYHLYSGDLGKARQEFELALRLTPDPPALLYTVLAEIADMTGDEKKAREFVFRAVELDPENETALSMAALFLLQEKEYEKALVYLETANRIKPGELQTLYYMAEAYDGLGRDDKLIDVYTQILAINPSLVDVRLNLGYLHTKRGDFKQAKIEYRTVLEKEPENEKAIFYLTYILLSEGNSEEASALFEKLDGKNLLNDEMLEDYAGAVFVDGQDPRTILSRIPVQSRDSLKDVTKGIFLFLDGKYDEAKTLFEREIEKGPGNLAALSGLVRIAEKKDNRDMEKNWRFVLAGTFFDLRNLEKALDEAMKVKTMDPELLENRYLLGDIYSSSGKKNEALQEYLFFRDKSDEKGDVYIKLGFLYDELKNHEESVVNFLKAIELTPKSDELSYYLGVEYRILGDHENAAAAFFRAAELNGQNAVYRFYLGASLERLGRVDEAIDHLERSVELDERNPAALNYLGYLLADKGVRLLEAKIFIEKALAMDPKNGAYLDSLGWVYYRLSDYDKAKEYLESAVNNMDRKEIENYLIYDHLGDVYSKLGMRLEAHEAWEKALELKNVEEIKRKIERLDKGVRN